MSRHCRREPWKSNFRKGRCELRGLWTVGRCVPCWRVWRDDRAAGRNAHLDRGGGDRSATWFCRVERSGADSAGGKSILWSSVHLSRETWRSDKSAVVLWGGAV